MASVSMVFELVQRVIKLACLRHALQAFNLLHNSNFTWHPHNFLPLLLLTRLAQHRSKSNTGILYTNTTHSSMGAESAQIQTTTDLNSQRFESLRFELRFLPSFSTDSEAILLAILLSPCDFKSRKFIAISNCCDCGFAIWTSKTGTVLKARTCLPNHLGPVIIEPVG